MKDADRAPLDGNCRFKLLFPPDAKIQGSVAMVLDLVTDKVRPAEARDRLLRTTRRPYKEYAPCPEAAAAWQAFKGYYSEHHVLMDGDDEHAEELKKKLIVVLQSDFKWFPGQGKQWVQIGNDDGDAVLKGSGDKLCFIMKARVKMFSRTDRFVG